MTMLDNNNINKCSKCYRYIHSRYESVRCNSCEDTFHKQCSKSTMTLYRNDPYCHSCLKCKDILRYNPFHDVLEISTKESEKIYSMSHYTNEDMHTISPLSEVLENCQIHSIDSLSIIHSLSIKTHYHLSF